MSYVKRFQNLPKKPGKKPMNSPGVQILGLMACIIMFRQLPIILKEDELENYANLKARLNAVNAM